MILPSPHTKFKNIRAVLFDIDGTLLNTFEFIYGSFEHALALHGYEPVTREHISATMGGPLTDCYRALVAGCDADILAESHRQFQADHLELVELFPSTIAVLDELKRRSMKLGAITSRSLRTSVKSMEVTGLVGYFDIILSAEDVINHKPHREPLDKAMAALGVSPHETVMVGDTTADIHAGKNAGTHTIAALYGFGGAGLVTTQPDVSIEELGEILELV